MKQNVANIIVGFGTKKGSLLSMDLIIELEIVMCPSKRRMLRWCDLQYS
jgi:hypothetical protein